jgi:hypothetical protein
LEILKNPILEYQRYSEYLRFLNHKEKRQIQKYQQKFGSDAVLKFKLATQKGERKVQL